MRVNGKKILTKHGVTIQPRGTENPDAKPGKTRLVYLMEFMKGKLVAETDEMKAKVEEYRLSEKEESPAPFDSNREKNLEIQS